MKDAICLAGSASIDIPPAKDIASAMQRIGFAETLLRGYQYHKQDDPDMGLLISFMHRVIDSSTLLAVNRLWQEVSDTRSYLVRLHLCELGFRFAKAWSDVLQKPMEDAPPLRGMRSSCFEEIASWLASASTWLIRWSLMSRYPTPLTTVANLAKVLISSSEDDTDVILNLRQDFMASMLLLLASPQRLTHSEIALAESLIRSHVADLPLTPGISPNAFFEPRTGTLDFDCKSESIPDDGSRICIPLGRASECLTHSLGRHSGSQESQDTAPTDETINIVTHMIGRWQSSRFRKQRRQTAGRNHGWAYFGYQDIIDSWHHRSTQESNCSNGRGHRVAILDCHENGRCIQLIERSRVSLEPKMLVLLHEETDWACGQTGSKLLCVISWVERDPDSSTITIGMELQDMQGISVVPLRSLDGFWPASGLMVDRSILFRDVTGNDVRVCIRKPLDSGGTQVPSMITYPDRQSLRFVLSEDLSIGHDHIQARYRVVY